MQILNGSHAFVAVNADLEPKKLAIKWDTVWKELESGLIIPENPDVEWGLINLEGGSAYVKWQEHSLSHSHMYVKVKMHHLV